MEHAVPEAAASPGDRLAAESVDRLLAGGSVVVSGPAGSGRSHVLELVAARLRAGGRRVLVVRATAAMATVPFGALLPLLAARGRMDGSPLLERLAAALLSLLLEDPDVVLLVDDAHLLDAPSAGVVHQAGVAGVPVVAAVRSDAVPPDAIARLVPDVGARLLVVGRLPPEGTAAMLRVLLGGPVDDRLSHVVHGRTGGLPLAVVLLSRIAVEAGAVRALADGWHLVGVLPASHDLGALRHDAVASLAPEALRAAELVALADGLTEQALRSLGALDGAEAAERAEVLSTSASGSVSLADPVLADALLAGMPVLRRRAHLADLLGAVAPDAALAERLHVAEWSTELGIGTDPARLLELADLTSDRQPERAEALVRAAIAAGAEVEGGLRLAELLAHQHRAAEAEQVLAGLDPAALPDDRALGLHLTRAFLLVFALARGDVALALLDPLPAVPPVAVLRSSAHLYLGSTARAAAEAGGLAEDAGLPADVRAHAALTRASALLFEADAAAFTAWLPVADPLVDAATAGIPEGPESLRLLEALAVLRMPLDPAHVERLARAGRARALAGGDDGERAQWAGMLGEAALLRGRAGEAVGTLRAALAARGRWTATAGPMAAGALVRALALSGDLDAAAERLGVLQASRVQPLLRPDVVLAEAELAACRGDLRLAGTLTGAAASAGRLRAADLWYAAVRYGRPGAASGFLAAAAALPGAGREAQRMHARAVAGRDPAGLEVAAAALEQAGLGWYALDATAQAVAAHARRDPTDPAPGERFRAMAAGLPTLRSPLRDGVGKPVLTEREAEVAELVVQGATARAIAAALGIGVRTVETHVAHVYRKLQVDGREGLRAAMRRP